jgi:uncharacterized protein (TIGR02118 family)
MAREGRLYERPRTRKRSFGMYKVVWLARFPKGSDRKEMSDYWTEEHGPRFMKVPGLVRYVQNHVIAPIADDGMGDAVVGFDGYSCAWFESRAAFESAMTSPEWLDTVADGVNVFDMDWLWGKSAALNEYVMRGYPSHFPLDKAEKQFKVVWFCRFNDLRAAPDHYDYWRNHHGPLALREPLMLRYTQNHVRAALGADGETDDPVDFDGFSESWFADQPSFEAAMVTPPWRDLVEDGDNVFDMEYLFAGMSAVLDERVMVP